MKPCEFSTGGAPARETVVLLHSSASSSRQWSALAALLAPRYDVRTVDFHGHGAQPAWPHRRPLTLADEVALVEPLLRTTDRVHLVGHSYGGAVALKVATMHPHAVASVAVYEPVLFRWLFDDDPDSDAAREIFAVAVDMRKYLNRGNPYRAAERFLSYWSGPATWVGLSDERRHAQACRMRAVLMHFDALFDEGLNAFNLRSVRAPMLFLSGARSVASMGRVCALLRTHLPGARHQQLPGLDHMGPVTHAGALNGDVMNFLARMRAARTLDVLREFA